MVFRYFSKEIKKGHKTWAEASISKPRPTIQDFEREIVTIPESLLNSINRKLGDTGFCLIVGPPNSGKTWLAYSIGYYFSSIKKKHVWYTTVDENFKEKDAWKEVSHYYEDRIEDTIYFIIEDAHLNRYEIEKFLLRIFDEHEKSKNIKFIFNTRKVGRYILRNEKIQDTFYDILVETLECEVKLTPTEISEIAKGMIRNFIVITNSKIKITEDELSSIVEKWGSDLYIVYLYLRSWNPEKQPSLIDADRERIHNFLWNGYGELCLSMKKQLQILYRIAAVCQFEPLKVTESFVRMESIDEEELKSLIQKGIIQVYPSNLMGISEGLAELVLSTAYAKDEGFREENTKKTFEDYVRLSMKEQETPNWNLVFQSLLLSREECSKLARALMLSILEDEEMWMVICKNAQRLHLGAFGSLAASISAVEPRKSKLLKSKYLSQNYIRLISNLKNSSIKRLRKLLPLMARVTSLNRFLKEFSISDSQRVIMRTKSRTTINALRSFLFTLEKWNIETSERQKWTQALTSLSESDFTKLIERGCTSLFRLGGLIANIRKFDSALAEDFVKRLSEIDLSNIFLEVDLAGENAGFAKIETINFFLSRRIPFAQPHSEKLVGNIPSETWAKLLGPASLGDGFWILWNIYRNNKPKACNLIKESLASVILNKAELGKKSCLGRLTRRKKTLSEKESNYIIPLLGLLQECEFDISDLPVLKDKVKKDLDEMLKCFQKWGPKEKPQPTLFVLSLIALKVKMKNEYENQTKIALSQEPMKSFIYNNDDVQVRKILKRLIEKYKLA